MSRENLRRRLEQAERILQEKSKKLEPAPEDPVEFAEKFFGVKAFRYQQKLAAAFTKFLTIVVRWCRQSGKSFFVAILLIWYALKHPGVEIGIVGPSLRQAKLYIQRINGLLLKIDPNYYERPFRKTMVRFPNGSLIQAFPNNPETIRGHTLHAVCWTEMNFTPDDMDMYDAISYAMATTNGIFIGESTPWSRNHLFYRMFTDDEAYPPKEVFRSHISWRNAVRPKGPLDPKFVERKKRETASDPSRWQREMEAEWAEDEDLYFPLDLTSNCIGTEKNVGVDLDYIPEELIFVGVGD